MKTEMDRLIRLRDVIGLTGLGRTSIYVMAKRGQFPKQMKIGRPAAAWSEAAVSAWIDARKNALAA